MRHNDAIVHIRHMMRAHGNAERHDKQGDDPGADKLTDKPTISSISSFAKHDTSPDGSAAGEFLPSSIDSSEKSAGYFTMA